MAYYAIAAGARPSQEKVMLSCEFYRSDSRRCDIDNLVKLVQDALNGVAYKDDSQIVGLMAAKHLDKEMPRTVVSISYYET